MSERLSGTVKCFDAPKGFGFISMGREDVFVHISQVCKQQLQIGDEVTFSKCEDTKGRLRAENVKGGTGEMLTKGKTKGRDKGEPKGHAGKGMSVKFNPLSGIEELTSAQRHLALEEAPMHFGIAPSVDDLFVELALADCNASSVSSEPLERRCGDVTVAAYNLLHPHYAVKYSEKEGVTAAGESNWSERALAIAALLIEGDLDAYLLQEVGLRQVLDLSIHMGADGRAQDLSDSDVLCFLINLGKYDCLHFTHPARAARDGVAILMHRERLQFCTHKAISILGKGVEEAEYGVVYMCAGAAVVRVLDRGYCLTLASVHFYDKKAIQPEETLLSGLRTLVADLSPDVPIDVVVWGGDCNRSYGSAPEGYIHQREGMRPTRGQKYIDWLFVSNNVKLSRSLATAKFIESTHRSIRSTGKPASDHRAEAVVLHFK